MYDPGLGPSQVENNFYEWVDRKTDCVFVGRSRCADWRGKNGGKHVVRKKRLSNT